MIVHLLQRTLPYDSILFTAANQRSSALIRNLEREGYYVRDSDTCEIPGVFALSDMGVVLYAFARSYNAELDQDRPVVSVVKFEQATDHFVEHCLNESGAMIDANDSQHPLHTAVAAAQLAGQTLACQHLALV